MPKGISRIDSPSKSTYGWYARAYKNGQTYTRLFSDRKYGSKTEALDKALAYHKETMCSLEKIPHKPRTHIVTCDKRSKSGVLGVWRIKKKRNTGQVTEYYSVTWQPKPGIHKYRLFSLKKYGEAEALRRALKLRHKK